MDKISASSSRNLPEISPIPAALFTSTFSRNYKIEFD